MTDAPGSAMEPLAYDDDHILDELMPEAAWSVVMAWAALQGSSLGVERQGMLEHQTANAHSPLCEYVCCLLELLCDLIGDVCGTRWVLLNQETVVTAWLADPSCSHLDVIEEIADRVHDEHRAELDAFFAWEPKR